MGWRGRWGRGTANQEISGSPGRPQPRGLGERRSLIQPEPRWRRWWLLVPLVVLLVWCPWGRPGALAAEWSVVPQMGLGGEYDSNINFSFRDRRSDIIFRVYPSVDLSYASDVSQYTGRLALTGMHYSRDSKFDKIDQNFSFSGKREVLPRLSLSFSGSYTLDTTLQEELTASGFIITRSPRQSFFLSPGLGYQLTERDTLALSYGYGQVIYQDPEFRDYTTHRVSLSYGHLLANARTTLNASISGSTVNYSRGGNDYPTLNLAAGVTYRVAEDFSLSAQAGINLTRFRELTGGRGPGGRIVLREETTFSVSPFLGLATTRRWTRTSLTVGINRTQSPSAAGRLLEYYQGFIGLSHEISERLKAGLDGSLYYSTSSREEGNYENLVFSFGPQMSYQLTERLTFTSSYRFGFRNDLVTDQTSQRHQVVVSLNYSWPFRWQR